MSIVGNSKTAIVFASFGQIGIQAITYINLTKNRCTTQILPYYKRKTEETNPRIEHKF